jgi:Ca2+-binding EF-hand superfamily protein
MTTREGKALSDPELLTALRSLPPVPMQQVIEEMQAAADPSVTLQKVTFNQLVTWIAALRSLASPNSTK